MVISLSIRNAQSVSLCMGAEEVLIQSQTSKLRRGEKRDRIIIPISFGRQSEAMT